LGTFLTAPAPADLHTSRRALLCSDDPRPRAAQSFPTPRQSPIPRLDVGLVRQGHALLRTPRAVGARAARHPLGTASIKPSDPAARVDTSARDCIRAL